MVFKFKVAGDLKKVALIFISGKIYFFHKFQGKVFLSLKGYSLYVQLQLSQPAQYMCITADIEF